MSHSSSTVVSPVDPSTADDSGSTLPGASDSSEGRRRGVLTRLYRTVLRVDPREATFQRRHFAACDPSRQSHLERIGSEFLNGYNTALDDEPPEILACRLNATAAEWRGFAFEGAAMALALLDLLRPRRAGRWQRLVNAEGDAHVYMMHVGVGWAMARLRRPWHRLTAPLDPLLRWLAYDGWGFHAGYFTATSVIDRQRIPRSLSGYARRAFDQGLGRSLWFVCGADSYRVADRIASFPSGRRSDLWSGVGLAATYAGSVEEADLQSLLNHAGAFALHVAQGASFAAEARRHAGHIPGHTEMACQVLCARPADAAAEVAVACRRDLPADSDDGTTPAFETWRQRIRHTMESSRG